MSAEQKLDRIEAIMAEIERLDAASAGQFRQASDRAAFDVAARIERKMQQKTEPKEAKNADTHAP